MRPNTSQSGFPTVKPPKRKQKNTPSRRRAEARRLVERIEHTTRARHEAWVEGDQANLTERQAHDLEALHGEKREMRRDIYATVPKLEGQPFYKGAPGR